MKRTDFKTTKPRGGFGRLEGALLELTVLPFRSMFSLLAQFARFKRGDASLFLVAALLALWAMPLSGQNVMVGSGHPYEAVLMLLSAEANVPRTLHLGVPAPVEDGNPAPDETPLVSKATAHCGAFQNTHTPETPIELRARRTHDLSAAEVASMSGVATNVRLN